MITLDLTNRQAYLLSQVFTFIGGMSDGPRGELMAAWHKLLEQRDVFETVDAVFYDGKIPYGDVGHDLPALYVDTTKEHEWMNIVKG
jgi:hypothetical protein